MRTPASPDKIRIFMQRLGAAVKSEGRVYLTGGASALLSGWREATMDIDLHADPEPSGFFEALPQLKDSLDINVELAAPFHFIPELSGWRERSPFIARHGQLDFHHFDFYSQALSKLERAYERDLLDVEQMTVRKLIVPRELAAHFEGLRSRLIRFPAIHENHFAQSIERYLEGHA